MANPRDFVPAKYKKPTTDKDNVVAASEVNSPTIVTPITPTNLATPDTQKTDSLWSGLASDETSKPLDNAIAISKQAMSADPNPTEQTDVIDTASPSEDSQSNIDIPSAGDTATPTKQFAKPKSKQNKLAGILVILFLVVGTMAGYFLMLQNQDGRQQASQGAPPYMNALTPNEDGSCPTGYAKLITGKDMCYLEGLTLPSGIQGLCPPPKVSYVASDGTKFCKPADLIIPTPPPTSTVTTAGQASCVGCYGTCWNGSTNITNSGGSVGGTVGGGSVECPANAWNDPNAIIAGTYWHCTPDNDSNPDNNKCARYTLNIPSTLNAAVEYFANNPSLAQELNIGQENSVMLQANGQPLALAPFLNCSPNNFGNDANGNPIVTDGYNTLSNNLCEENNGICSWTETETVEVTKPDNTKAEVTVTKCYLNGDYYVQNYASQGLTWSPYNTGCGDGVHDYYNQTTGSSAGTDPSYLGDCNTWHFTTCLDQGSGVNGLGCGITTTPPNEPPNEPPSEPPTTTTPPPTGTPTPTPTLPPQLVCTDIEMLDASGSAMTGDDDQDLVDGDRVRFRSSASADDPDATFEFRILPPNTYAWIDITDTSATAAKDVSAFYTIVSSGHHVVQSRLCIDGVCQAWETNDENNVSDNLFISRGATCQAPPGVVSDRMLRTCDQRSDCPTDHYCGTDIVCQSDSDCSNGFVCYQPPMPPCPSGMSCNQRMPAKICADVDPTLITTTTR